MMFSWKQNTSKSRRYWCCAEGNEHTQQQHWHMQMWMHRTLEHIRRELFHPRGNMRERRVTNLSWHSGSIWQWYIFCWVLLWRNRNDPFFTKNTLKVLHIQRSGCCQEVQREAQGRRTNQTVPPWNRKRRGPKGLGCCVEGCLHQGRVSQMQWGVWMRWEYLLPQLLCATEGVPVPHLRQKRNQILLWDVH